MRERAVLTNADMVICRCRGFQKPNNGYKEMEWTLKPSQLPPEDPFSYREIRKHVFSFCIGWPWDKLYKRSFLSTKDLWFPEWRNSEDAVFVFLALLQAERISTLDQVLVYHREEVSGSVSASREHSWNDFWLAITAIKAEMERWGIYLELEQSFVNWALQYSLWNLNSLTGSAHEALYDKLQRDYFEALNLASYPRTFFQYQKDYRQYLAIRDTTYLKYREPHRITQLMRRFTDVVRTEGLSSAFKRLRVFIS